MTRDDAVIFLSEQWPALAAVFGIGAFDSATAGWKSALDSALRALGVVRADLATATVAVGDEATYEALLRYYGARLLYAEATSKVDVSVSGDLGLTRANSQLAKQIKDLLELYTADLAVYDIAVGDQWSWGVFTPDYLGVEAVW